MKYYKLTDLMEKYGYPIRVYISFFKEQTPEVFTSLHEMRKRIIARRKQSGMSIVFWPHNTRVVFCYPDGREQRVGEINGAGQVILDEDEAAKKVRRKSRENSEEFRAWCRERELEHFLDRQDYYGHFNTGRSRSPVGRRFGHGTWEDRDEFEREDDR